MYIDLKPLVKQIENSIEVGQVAPTLAIMHYGEQMDSKAYIRSIEKKAAQLGVKVIIHDLEWVFNPVAKITELVHLADAVLPVSPIESSIIKTIIKNRLDSYKDIDNYTGRSIFQNCTAEATLEILKYLQIRTEEKVCIVGRHIGLEIFKVLLKADYSPTIMHSRTPNDLTKELIRNADVIISATGVKGLIKKDMVQDNAVVIDVGLGDVAGDVAEVADVTPIKNGVGAVTTAVLFKHIFQTVN